MSDGKLKPTTKMRWITREGAQYRILQQWWAPDVPSYMVDPTEGEWRDVPVQEET